MTTTPDFYRAFDPTVEFSNSLGTFRCEPRHIATLKLPTGRIVAGDPVVDLSTTPLDVAVPPGEYPVIVAIAPLESEGERDERIACAMVRFSDAQPVRWSNAAPAGEDQSALKEGEVFGYGVDSGIGCFASAEAAEALDARLGEDEEYSDHILAEMEKNYLHTRDWASIVPDPATGANVVAFSSGLGDGFYQSFWGYDAEGGVACLVTDFGLVGPDPEE